MQTVYDRDGFEVVRGVIPVGDLEPLRDRISDQVGLHAQQLLDEGKVDDLFEDLPFGKRLAALHAKNELPLRQWNEPFFGPELHALINHSGIAEALEPHLGSNVSFNGDYHLRPKLPDSERTAFPLHQDSQYYGQASRRAHIVTVWIPLVDVDETNGCLYVIPESHEWELFGSARDELGNMRSFEDVEARGTPVPIPMALGDILLFSNMTFHGSKVNRSDGVRWSTDIRYIRTPGTYDASDEVLASEKYMVGLLAKNGRHAPMVVRGDGSSSSFDQWKEKSELRQTETKARRSHSKTTSTIGDKS